MTKLRIRIVPDPVLRAVAQPVKSVDATIRRLMDDMVETMYAADGIGLAAPQVGELVRVIVVDSGDGNPANALRLANPEIIWTADETYACKEGCLSIPDQFAEVTRPRAIRVRYLDRDGVAQELTAEDLLATCIQHEIDHLNGALFFDYVSALKRDMMTRKVEKTARMNGGHFYDEA